MHRRRAARTRPADLRHHLARRRADGDVRVAVGDLDADAPAHRRPVRPAGGRDRAVDGVQARRVRRAGQRPGPADRVPPGGRVQPPHGRRRPRDRPTRGGRAVPAGGRQRRARRLLRARRRAGQPGRRDDGAGQGRPPARRADRPGRRRHRRAAHWRAGQRGAHGARRRRGRGRRQLHRDVGPPAGRRRRDQRAAAGRRALLPDHRTGPRDRLRLAGDRGPGALRLLPRGGRRADDRPVRAGVRAVARGRGARRRLVRPAPAGLGPHGAVRRAGDQPCADRRRDRHPHVLLRTGELHARPGAGARRGAGAARLLRGRRPELDRHPHRRRRRPGAGPLGARTVGPMST